MCQDNLGVDGVVVMDGDQDTKKVRIGARSSVAKVKESETEDKGAQQALFEKTGVSVKANSKDCEPSVFVSLFLGLWRRASFF